MEALLVQVMLWGRDHGYQRFSLGMAPLSGFEQSPLASLWHRTGGGGDAGCIAGGCWTSNVRRSSASFRSSGAEQADSNRIEAKITRRIHVLPLKNCVNVTVLHTLCNRKEM